MAKSSPAVSVTLAEVLELDAVTPVRQIRGQVDGSTKNFGAVDPVAMGAEHGRAADWCADEMVALGEMETDGLVIRDGDRIVLTSAGLALSRVVASVFDAWPARSEARHSVAV